MSTPPADQPSQRTGKPAKPLTAASIALAKKMADVNAGRANAQGHKPHTAALNPHLSSHPNRKLGRKQ